MNNSGNDKKRKRRMWRVDPTIFQTRRRGTRERLLESFKGRLKSAGKSLAFLLLLTYPVTLTLLGILFGGAVYWGTLAGTAGLMALLLSKLGYARNFEGRDIKLLRSLVGLCLGFLLAAGLFLGLAKLNLWMIPLVFGLLFVGLFYVMRKS